ncbi:MAG TPA: hypothetical protein VGE52_01670, partial [Pirellulales bacterium]
NPSLVEFRDGRYWLLNQSGQSLTLAGRSVAPHAESEWPAGAELGLANATRLRLVVEGDPAPVERPFHRPASVAPVSAGTVGAVAAAEAKAEAPSGGAARPDEPPKKSSAVVLAQFGVIVACALGIAAIIVFGGEEPASDSDSGARLQSLVESGFALEDPLAQRLTRRLQSAEAAFRRGDRAASLRRFQELHQYLAARRSAGDAGSASPSPLRKFEDDLDRFVSRRLSNLSAPPESG